MAVSWVVDTTPGHRLGTWVSKAAPSGLQDGDVLLAGVYARSPINSGPSGWTKVTETSTFSDGALQFLHLELWKKNAVIAADSGVSYRWDQDDFAHMAVVYAAARDASTVDSTATAIESMSSDWTITASSLSASADGQMLLVFAANSDPDNTTESRSPTAPSGGTLGSGASSGPYRVAVAYRLVNSGQSLGGDFAMHNTGSPPATNALAAITVRLAATTEDPVGLISAPAVLGAASVQARQTAGLAAAPSPLGAAQCRAWHDLSIAVDDSVPTQYIADLVTPTGYVRVPISSWQATLQTDAAQYLQCVVPNPAPYSEDLIAATSFRVSRRLMLRDGQVLDYLVAEAVVDSINYARGGTNYSATVTGYAAAAEQGAWGNIGTRALRGVRAIFITSSTLRVSCSIDWALMPGQPAVAHGYELSATYINYFASENDAYMDVGYRPAAP